MVLVDAHYRFIFVDIGQYGSNTDGPVFQKSEFGTLYMKGQLNVPGPKYLPKARYLGAMPHVIVADEAFSLCPTIMRPFPRDRNAARMPRPCQVFNYHLSTARRIVENAFGILAQHFHIYNTRMWYSEHTVVKIVKATCVLHNYLRDKNMNVANIYTDLNPDRLEYLGKNGAVVDLGNLPGYRSSNEAQRIRRVFTHYFNSVAGRTWAGCKIDTETLKQLLLCRDFCQFFYVSLEIHFVLSKIHHLLCTVKCQNPLSIIDFVGIALPFKGSGNLVPSSLVPVGQHQCPQHLHSSVD